MICRDAGGERGGVGGGEGDGVEVGDEEDDGDGGDDEAGDGVWKDSLKSLEVDVDEAEDEDEVSELMSDWGGRGVEVRIKLGWLRLVCLFSVGLFMNK